MTVAGNRQLWFAHFLHRLIALSRLSVFTAGTAGNEILTGLLNCVGNLFQLIERDDHQIAARCNVCKAAGNRSRCAAPSRSR